MAWRSHGRTNTELVENLWRHGVIKTQRVKNAMLAVDRAHFVPEGGGGGSSASAYYDTPLPIGFGATISAPHMHAHALEELAPKLVPGARVLDVGSGSGYLLAAAARLVTPGGAVWGIEHMPGLVEWSRANLRKDARHAAWLEDGTISVQAVDGFGGLPAAAPFDAIHVGAAAATIPDALVQQLAVGGRMVIPVGTWAQQLVALDRHEDGSVTRTDLVGVQFIPLTSRDKQEASGRY